MRGNSKSVCVIIPTILYIYKIVWLRRPQKKEMIICTYLIVTILFVNSEFNFTFHVWMALSGIILMFRIILKLITILRVYSSSSSNILLNNRYFTLREPIGCETQRNNVLNLRKIMRNFFVVLLESFCWVSKLIKFF